MQIIKKNLKIGIITIRTESINDLYILSLMIFPNDQVSSITSRRVRRTGAQSRSGEKSERITLNLSLNIDSVEFSEAQEEGILYLKGNVISGPEKYVSIGESHSFGIKIDQNITIKKRKWPKYQLKKLEKAVEDSKKPKFGLIAIEEGEVTLAILDNYKITVIGKNKQYIPKKLAKQTSRLKAKNKFIEKTISIILNKFDSSIHSIFVAGPGNLKLILEEEIKIKIPHFSKKIIIEDASSGKINSIYSLSKTDTVKQALKDHQTNIIMQKVDKFEEDLIKSPKKVSYSYNNVNYANLCGAIDTLLINDKLLRSTSKMGEQMLQLIESAENKGSNVLIINSKSESGIIVSHFGGLIALLRYEINEYPE